jgi:hypothetical protein
MWETVNYPLTGDRWTPCVKDIDVVGFDLTGATFKAEVRDTKDQSSGSARVTLNTVTSEIEGVRLLGVITADADDVAAYAAAGVTIQVGDKISQLRVRIVEATMEAMDVANDASQAGSDGAAFWDMHITPSGGDKFVAFAGTFTVAAGVTQ